MTSKRVFRKGYVKKDGTVVPDGTTTVRIAAPEFEIDKNFWLQHEGKPDPVDEIDDLSYSYKDSIDGRQKLLDTIKEKRGEAEANIQKVMDKYKMTSVRSEDAANLQSDPDYGVLTLAEGLFKFDKKKTVQQEDLIELEKQRNIWSRLTERSSYYAKLFNSQTTKHIKRGEYENLQQLHAEGWALKETEWERLEAADEFFEANPDSRAFSLE